MALKEARSAKKKKKARWAEYLMASVPAVSGADQNNEWAKRLKEKINSSWDL